MAAETDRDAVAPPAGTSPRGQRLLRAGLLILTAIVLVDAVLGDKGVFALMRVRDERRALEADVDARRLENQRLLDQTRRFREDPATIEELARRDLGMIKPGEKLFIIRDREHPQPR
jgi:cell division protein FtsB